MSWYYNGTIFIPEEHNLNDYVGFVYRIIEKDTDMKYIGKKLFWRQIKRPPLKGKKRVRRSVVESDWKTYCGSSDQVNENVNKYGIEHYYREILRLCKTKGECSYFEAKLQFDNDVLLRDDYYNGIINCRINRKHLKLND